MLKHRLIFTLLMDRGVFMLSRNFRLQKVGGLSWIKEHYDFNSIAFSIDELVVLNVERGRKDTELFSRNVSELTKNCFMPLAAGGGVNSVDVAFRLFDAGADKLVVNTAIIKDAELVKSLVRTFGGQSIIASIDYKIIDGREHVVTDNGSFDTDLSVEAAVRRAVDLGAGEIYLTSMNRDGTGQGYDIETLRKASAVSPVPIIASGGAGRFDHMAEAINKGSVQAVSTANLFNFMAGGLTETRAVLKEHGIAMAEWNVGSGTGVFPVSKAWAR
ncbi:MAG: imidazole glycerol phosphate synthase subunit HisF [Candidatus Omnitrophica bacterium]|nr:imidazole glycerol phosphate synthase subunit HisF [Candidatus Omnitrophota bacterium]